MTTQPPWTEEQPPLPVGTNGDAASVDPDVAVLRPVERRNGTAKPRARRAADYRLRGLDLDAADAPSLADEPTRPVHKKHPSRRRRRRRLLLQWLVVLTVIAAVAVVLRVAVVQPFSVTSTSMVPTLQSGTDVLVVKSSRLAGPLRTGDIVVFHEPSGACSGGSGSQDVVKRVIGLPGQTIWSVGDSVYVDGRRLHEAGWYNPPFGEIGPTAIVRTDIPQGSYFVMGDNRTDSCDSRSFGPIRKSAVVGKVVATVARHGHPFVHLL